MWKVVDRKLNKEKKTQFKHHFLFYDPKESF